MKKRIFKILIVYLTVIVLFVWLTPKEVKWFDDFRANSKEPYGSYVLFEQISSIFSSIDETNESLYTTVKDSTLTDSNYLFITSQFNPAEQEWHNLLEYTKRGNNVFISANNISSALLDSLNISFNYTYSGFSDLLEDQLQVAIGDTMKNSYDQKYYFEKQSNMVYFSTRYDSLKHPEILSVAKSGYNDKKWNRAVLVKQAFGEGFLYFHSLPYAFTNYYLLHKNNHAYASQLLSFLPNQQTFWDTYYKPQSTRKPITEVFLSQRSFKWAYLLGASLILLLLIFKVKRKQRLIPIVKAPENRSLEFTKTIGDLYFNTRDNKDLVLKMERHFKEFLKEKYNIYNYTGTKNEMELLAQKSSKSIELISSINAMFKSYPNKDIEDKSINKLSQKLHIFYYGRTK